jgi:hypothetical protein
MRVEGLRELEQAVVAQVRVEIKPSPTLMTFSDDRTPTHMLFDLYG